MTACALRLKEYSSTDFPDIDKKIFFPIFSEESTLTSLSALTPVMMLRRLGSEEKGVCCARELRMIVVSFLSRCFLELLISLFYSPDLLCLLVKDCMARLVSASKAGMDNNQTRRCCSDMPLPLVNPPLVFRLLIKTCSIMRSVGKPAQYRSLRLIL